MEGVEEKKKTRRKGWEELEGKWNFVENNFVEMKVKKSSIVDKSRGKREVEEMDDKRRNVHLWTPSQNSQSQKMNIC